MRVEVKGDGGGREMERETTDAGSGEDAGVGVGERSVGAEFRGFEMVALREDAAWAL